MPGEKPSRPFPAGQSPDVVVDWIVSADNRKEQSIRIRKAAQYYQTSREILTFFNRLVSNKGGHRLALLITLRMPRPLPKGLILLSAPLLQSADVHHKLRVAVAAKLISSMPDRIESVGPIVRALTAGLGRIRTLERLVELQSRVQRSEVLDRYVAEAEAKTRLACPKCQARLSRSELIQHLWKKHRLIYEHGQAREPNTLIEQTVESYRHSHDPEMLDQIYLWTTQLFPQTEPHQVHQAILARSEPDEVDPNELGQLAGEQGLGLCPVCYFAIAVSLPTLPDSLAGSEGRLLGEGYQIEIRGRQIDIRYPDGSSERVADPQYQADARTTAVQVASAIAFLACFVAAFFPPSWINPLIPTAGLCVVAIISYQLLLMLQRNVASVETCLVDAAWDLLADSVGRSPEAITFLIRLCRTSLGRGTPERRSKIVWEMTEHAEVLAEKSPRHTQWLAAVRILQAHDAARIGKEWGNQLKNVWEPFLQSRLSPTYADAVGEILLTSEILSDRDAARLRIQLPAHAFENGWTAADLNQIAERCPHFERILAGNREWLELLAVTWKLQANRAWENSVGPAQSVFEWTRSGGGSVRTLLAYPDTLLIATVESPFDRELGEILVGRRGVTIGDFTVADPEALLETETTRKGTPVLVFGPHRIATDRKVPERVLRILRGWLRFRTQRLINPALAQTNNPSPTGRASAILESGMTSCPVCQTSSFIRVGEVGRVQS